MREEKSHCNVEQKQAVMPGWLQHKTSSNVMATLSQEKADNCIGKAALYSELATMKDHHELKQKKPLLVIFAKFAFDWSNISVIPSACRGSFKSVSASAVNLVGTKIKCIRCYAGKSPEVFLLLYLMRYI